MTIQFKITNMSCASCALINEKNLKATRGVANAKVNFSTGLATVDFDEKTVSEKRLKEIIVNNGYGVI